MRDIQKIEDIDVRIALLARMAIYIEPKDEISYSADMQPFFDLKCVSCHSGSTPPNLSAPGSYDDLINNNYIDLDNPEQSLLYTKINVGGSMAQYASSAERAMTLQWIQEEFSGQLC